MTLAPLLAAPTLVQVHAFAALAAFLLGAVQMASAKGTPNHRVLGFAWIGLMVVVAGSSFGIASSRPLVGSMSWIHGLSALTLALLPLAFLYARAGRIAHHRWTMIALFLSALVIPGGFTLVPGRIMHAVAFGPASP